MLNSLYAYRRKSRWMSRGSTSWNRTLWHPAMADEWLKSPDSRFLRQKKVVFRAVGYHIYHAIHELLVETHHGDHGGSMAFVAEKLCSCPYYFGPFPCSHRKDAKKKVAFAAGIPQFCTRIWYMTIYPFPHVDV